LFYNSGFWLIVVGRVKKLKAFSDGGWMLEVGSKKAKSLKHPAKSSTPVREVILNDFSFILFLFVYLFFK